MLAELKRHLRFLVVVTNGDRVSARVMANALGSPFSEIITEEDMRVAKPDPRAFQYFITHLERLGVKRERILHVAQSQYHDIGAARAPPSPRPGSTVATDGRGTAAPRCRRTIRRRISLR